MTYPKHHSQFVNFCQLDLTNNPSKARFFHEKIRAFFSKIAFSGKSRQVSRKKSRSFLLSKSLNGLTSLLSIVICLSQMIFYQI